MPNIKVVWDKDDFNAQLTTLSGKSAPRKIKTETGEVKELVMKRDGSPVLERKSHDGKDVQFARQLEDGTVIPPGTVLSNIYVDEDGNAYNESELQVFYVASDETLIPATKNSKTDVFELVSFEPLSNYTDQYQMERYYQVLPSEGTSKKDVTRKLTARANTLNMKKLWDYLNKQKVIGRGTLNITSAGYLPSTAYIRAVILDGNKWTLEVAVFKQRKEFLWVEEQELVPAVIKTASSQVLDI